MAKISSIALRNIQKAYGNKAMQEAAQTGGLITSKSTESTSSALSRITAQQKEDVTASLMSRQTQSKIDSIKSVNSAPTTMTSTSSVYDNLVPKWAQGFTTQDIDLQTGTSTAYLPFSPSYSEADIFGVGSISEYEKNPTPAYITPSEEKAITLNPITHIKDFTENTSNKINKSVSDFVTTTTEPVNEFFDNAKPFFWGLIAVIGLGSLAKLTRG